MFMIVLGALLEFIVLSLLWGMILLTIAVLSLYIILFVLIKTNKIPAKTSEREIFIENLTISIAFTYLLAVSISTISCGVYTIINLLGGIA